MKEPCINTLCKYYFSDIGLRNAILDMRQIEETHIMENIIYNELVVRGYSVDVGMVEIKRQNEDGKWIRIQLEVDFIASLGSKKYYVQSALSIPNREKRYRNPVHLQTSMILSKKSLLSKTISCLVVMRKASLLSVFSTSCSKRTAWIYSRHIERFS